MPDWVRTDIDFDRTAAILYVSDRRLATAIGGGTFNFRDLLLEKPQTIAKVIGDLIDDVRPDLAGGIVYGVRLDMMRLQWEFTYAHRSLPATPPGERYRRLPLFPDEAREDAAPEINMEALREQWEKIENGLQRHIVTRGASFEPIIPNPILFDTGEA